MGRKLVPWFPGGFGQCSLVPLFPERYFFSANVPCPQKVRNPNPCYPNILPVFPFSHKPQTNSFSYTNMTNPSFSLKMIYFGVLLKSQNLSMAHLLICILLTENGRPRWSRINHSVLYLAWHFLLPLSMFSLDKSRLCLMLIWFLFLAWVYNWNLLFTFLQHHSNYIRHLFTKPGKSKRKPTWFPQEDLWNRVPYLP